MNTTDAFQQEANRLRQELATHDPATATAQQAFHHEVRMVLFTTVHHLAALLSRTEPSTIPQDAPVDTPQDAPVTVDPLDPDVTKLPAELRLTAIAGLVGVVKDQAAHQPTPPDWAHVTRLYAETLEAIGNIAGTS